MSFLCMPDSFATDSYKVILSSIGRLNVSWRRDLRRSRFGERFSTPSANGSSSEWRFVATYTRSISRIPSSCIQEEGILEILRVYGATNLHSLDEPFADGVE